MKTIIKKVIVWLLLSVIMMILWLVGLVIGNAVFPSELMDSELNSGGGGEILFFLVCLLNTSILMYFIHNSMGKGWKLVLTIFLITFGIQYFMSQMETLWFNDSLNMPLNSIWAITFGGAIMILLFSIAATWLTGNFKYSETEERHVKFEFVPILKRVILLSVVIWPLIYFLAGYLIAWQSENVRLFYSGSTELVSFISIMKENILSGLYYFQIPRGVLWILIGSIVLGTTEGSLIRKGIVLGLLFAILGSSQLLLPNPIMSEPVRMAHLLETSTSSFLWGNIISWYLGKFISNVSIKKAGKIPTQMDYDDG